VYLAKWYISSVARFHLGARTSSWVLSQRFESASGPHIELHQNTFANGRECAGIFQSTDFGPDEHNVSNSTATYAHGPYFFALSLPFPVREI